MAIQRDDLSDVDPEDDHFLDMLRCVISETQQRSQHDVVSRALLYFLVRVGNTWRSIRTLRKHTSDAEGFIVDAGTLLRAMFDAYLQAEFIVHDPGKSVQRANDYLDFQYIERYKMTRRIMQHDNPIANALKASATRAIGEKQLQTDYDRVGRYLHKRKKGNNGGSGVRNQWYAGDLAAIARELGKEDEYDILLAIFHGCVHSSAFAVQRGPMISSEHVLHWASSIAARIARLCIERNGTKLSELHAGILDALCRPYFDEYQ